MTQGTTLYYPYIHPRQTDNLKAALIYWDRVRRIVPASVTHGHFVQGDDNDSQLLVEHELLVSTRPEPYEDAASKRFFKHLEPQSVNFTIDLVTAREMANRNHVIHMDKIGEEVLIKLQELRLAHRFGDWVAMRYEIGAFYMSCLASEMAKSMSAPLLTDSPEDAVLGEAFLFEAEDKTHIEAEGEDEPHITKTLLNVGIKLPSPKQLSHVSMETIVDFVGRRADEKQAFRRVVEEVLKVAGSIEDPNALEDYLASKRIEIELAVGNLRRTLDEIHVSGFSSAAKITIPTGAAAAIAALPISPTGAAILAATSLTLAAISCYAETRGKLRQARAASPYHYLVSLTDDLGV